ncbi:MAG: hypothetical protein JWQ42_2379 [Edaphobacter sp.]|jgi:hypothetical protein|nr:hypothetical protein [Edaphobacter sp.]
MRGWMRHCCLRLLQVRNNSEMEHVSHLFSVFQAEGKLFDYRVGEDFGRDPLHL